MATPQNVPAKTWERPELNRLGKIVDVAPRTPGGGEGTNKQS